MAAESDKMLIAYTDGACAGNPGPGGWAWAIDGGASANDDGASASGGEPISTNQRMEVNAVLEALRTLLPKTTGVVRIVSDSTYVVNCFKQRWWANWERNGWKNSQKQPVANQDLWKPLVEIVKPDISRIEFVWVKGHSGNRMNDLVDRLAVAACKVIAASALLPSRFPVLTGTTDDAADAGDAADAETPAQHSLF